MSMTHTATQVNASKNTAAIHHAEMWVTASNLEKSIKKELAEIQNDKKQAAEALAGVINHGDTVTVFNNRKMTFYNQTQPTVAYAQVLKGLAPHLTSEQTTILNALLTANTKPEGKVVRRLTPVK